jgi:voltage-gated potassium channel
MRKQLEFLGFLLAISFVTTTWLFWVYEQNVNPNINSFVDTLWWWVVSSTTVGYGDIVPITPQGRIAGVVTIIVGIYCYTSFITITADRLHELMNRRRLGAVKVTATDHIVICEYTAFADELIQVLDRYPELAKREVVIISDLVQVNPYPRHHYVRGVPISPMALRQANIETAAYVFVFANVRFLEPDLKTLHTVSRIQKLNDHATLFVELTDPDSEFTHYLNESTVILRSKELLESVLAHQSVDFSEHFTPAQSSSTSHQHDAPQRDQL